MDIKYHLIKDYTENLNGIISSLFLLIILLILFLRFIYPKRYILNIYKPNVYIFEYEAKQRNYFSFYAMMSSLINYLILFFILINIVRFYTKGHLTQKTIFQLIILVLGILIYKILSDFFFVVFIKKTSLFSSLRFIRISFESYLYFFLFFISFFMLFFNHFQPILFIINEIILFLFLIYNLQNFYISLSKHIDLKNSKIILYLCISEILPIIFIIYWLSFQII